MTILSASVLLILVMDPLGNVPIFVALLKDMDDSRRRRIIVREHLIALGVLVLFLFGGRFILDVFQIEQPALSIGGGIILFLIALRMIFARADDLFGALPDGEPFIVPLAIPFIAGPSTMTTVLLLATRESARWFDWMLALVCAWTVSIAILLPATTLSRLLGTKALLAFERLMGLLLTAVAVQMLLSGVKQYIDSLGR